MIRDRCNLARKRLVGQVHFSYSILPTPLYAADPKNFISVVGTPFSLYGIFSASKAYRTTTPAQFEMNVKLRYSKSSDEAEITK